MNNFNKTMILAFTVLLNSCGPQTTTGTLSNSLVSTPYYRFWQGWKRKDISQAEFLNRLAAFMPLTPETHAKNGLVGYTVGIPPKNNASWIADEFALVTYASKEIYERAKATPEGQAYADAHWNLFEKGPSKSAVPTRLHPGHYNKLSMGEAYDVLSLPVNWRTGYTTFYFGIRSKGLTNNQYEAGMSRHVEAVKRAFYPKGMKAYVILLEGGYEIAYQNWKSRAHFEAAMKSEATKSIFADAGRLLKTFMFQPAAAYDGTAKPNQAINFRF